MQIMVDTNVVLDVLLNRTSHVNESAAVLKAASDDIQEFISASAITDIYYIEAVDDRTYLYLENECYESRRRLYEFEEILPERSFVRISKSVIVNMMKIVAIRPALNGRFLCQLKNDENVIISRKYVPEVREKLRG